MTDLKWQLLLLIGKLGVRLQSVASLGPEHQTRTKPSSAKCLSTSFPRHDSWRGIQNATYHTDTLKSSGKTMRQATWEPHENCRFFPMSFNVFQAEAPKDVENCARLSTSFKQIEGLNTFNYFSSLERR